MTVEAKSNLEKRLGRIRGQVDGIQRMVEDERYCVDIMMQVSAARAALSKVSKLLLEAHIQTCVTSAFNSSDKREQREKMSELIKIFDKNCSC